MAGEKFMGMFDDYDEQTAKQAQSASPPQQQQQQQDTEAQPFTQPERHRLEGANESCG